jgi:hypothetical protein
MTAGYQPATAPGTEPGGGLAEHEARSAARRLVFALTEAWDAGDEQGFADCFSAGATVTGLGDGPGAGTPSLRFRQHLAATSWSLHWLGNEQVSAWDGHAGGAWLWWSFEELSSGRPAYAGGDLGAVFEQTGRGYLISDLEITERYRVPVDVGWLNDELPGPDAWEPRPGTAARPAPPRIRPAAPPGQDGCVAEPAAGLTGEAGLADGAGVADPVPQRLQVLAGECALRQLMAAFVRGLEEQLPAAELAALWSETGRYTSPAGCAEGQSQLTVQLAGEVAAERPVMRILGNGAVEATAGHATGRWRDLWVAVGGGQPRWQAHQYRAEAVRAGDGGWLLESVHRERILDVAYGSGWAERPGGERF